MCVSSLYILMNITLVMCTHTYKYKYMYIYIYENTMNYDKCSTLISAMIKMFTFM